MPLETGTTIDSLDDSWPLSGDPTSQGDNHLRLIKSVLKTQFPGITGDGFNTAITVLETEINWLSGLTGNVQTQFNALSTRITALEGVLTAPVGTTMVFYQASAPSGWQKQTTRNDYMMRVISGNGGGFAGSDSPILNNKVPTHNHTASSGFFNNAHNHTYSGNTSPDSNLHTHTGTTTSNGSHSHNTDKDRVLNNFILNGANANAAVTLQGTTGPQNMRIHNFTSTDGLHNHTFTTSYQNDTHVHLASGTVSTNGANHSHTVTVNNNAGSNWTPKYMNVIVAVKS